MKINRPAIYLVIAVAAAFVILFLERPDSSRIDGSVQRTFIPGFDSALVERIEISQLLDGALLRREGEGWVVAEMPTQQKIDLYRSEGKALAETQWRKADRSKVSTALGGFGGLDSGVIVSNNPENRALYQVGVAGLSLKLIGSDGKTIADLVIGKNGPDYGSTYISRAGSNDVYLVNRALVGLFSPVAEDWLAEETQKDPAGK